jgi:hypothetical protein
MGDIRPFVLAFKPDCLDSVLKYALHMKMSQIVSLRSLKESQKLTLPTAHAISRLSPTRLAKPLLRAI